jgi:hypothetical protein
VRLGSEVLLVYPAGDCDVAMVTGLERYGRTVYVAVSGQLPQAVDVGALAPYETEDHDDEGALEAPSIHEEGI